MKIKYGYEVWDFGDIEACGVSLQVSGRGGVHDESFNKIPPGRWISENADVEHI